MKDYGSVEGKQPSRRPSSMVKLSAISLLAAIGMVALVVIYQNSMAPSALLAVSETDALAALKSSDELLSNSAISSDALKLAQQMLAAKQTTHSRAYVLRKAAETLRAQENARVQRLKQELAHEEQNQAMVDQRAAKMLIEANAKQTRKEIEAAAEAQFEKAKQEAIQAAAKTIEQASIAKEIAEKAAEQKLGANNDKYLDLNPPSTKQKDPFSDLDPPVYKANGKRAQPMKGAANKGSQQQLGANNDKFIDMNPPNTPQKDPFADLDPPIVKANGKQTQPLKKAEAKVASLRRELAFAQAQAAKAQKKMTHLAEEAAEAKEEAAEPEQAAAPSDRDPPEFYENYKKGMMGPGAVSKWVSADHPEGHKDCKLHDIDCDELWPWGKVPTSDLPQQPPKRSGPLGDNLVGVFGQDDVVVPTEDSGLLASATPYVDQFDHWPVNSKKNKDLLYGRGRYIIGNKYLGVGDQYVPIDKVEAMSAKAAHTGSNPLADLMFGSWEQGFHKPATKEIKKDVNMFNQPYRQHWSVVQGKGHQVFTNREEPDGPTLGEADDEE